MGISRLIRIGGNTLSPTREAKHGVKEELWRERIIECRNGFLHPVQETVPALAAACDCGCEMTDCTCVDGDCDCGTSSTSCKTSDTTNNSIAALRQQAVMVMPQNNTVPQTGDKGVMACSSIALISWLILLSLLGAKKKEEV